MSVTYCWWNKMYDINQSIRTVGTPEYNTLSEEQKYLNLVYNIDLLLDLAQTTTDILYGTVGEFYWQQRKDHFEEYVDILIKQYLIPVKIKIDQFVELNVQKEFSSYDEEKFTDLVYKIKSNFKDTLTKTFNSLYEMYRLFDKKSKSVFMKNSVDWFQTHPRLGTTIKNIYNALYLSNLLEEEGNYREAVELLRITLNTISTIRESRIRKKAYYSKNPLTLLYVHLANHKIIENKSLMDEHYKVWEDIILKKERLRYREDSKIEVLDDDEAEEEAYEVSNFEKLLNKQLYNDSSNPDQDILTKIDPSLSDHLFTNKDDYLHDLHADVIFNLYRCQIKLGQELQVIHNQTHKLLSKQGLDLEEDGKSTELSSTISSKFKNKYTKNMSKARKEFKLLHQNYQDSKRICKFSEK